MPTRGGALFIYIRSMKLKLFSIYGIKPVRLVRGKWSKLPWSWKHIRGRVDKLQRVIYNASKANDIRKVRRLQKLLFNSTFAKLLAVRRVTQDNSGKKTAGIDGVKDLTPDQRLFMVGILSVPTKARSLRRVWIPKPGKPELRPLGIPCMLDRCLQALFKLGLEPEWEAKFEENSYGFRPGRSAKDALAAIENYVQKKAKYVIDADIAKCFDLIDHKALLDKIGMKGSFRAQLKYWLEAGVLDGATFSETTTGTPQGGVISPLLANIALHGLEKTIKDFVSNIPMTWSSGESIRKSRRSETVGIVRYADDFVILHHDKQVILAILDKVKEFLASVGLSLSTSKTRLTHTLMLNPSDIEPGFDGKVGFDFLGYTVRQFVTNHRSAKDTTGKKLHFCTFLFPSQKSVNKHQAKLHDLILKKGKRLSQAALIALINPVIRGWSNYFGSFDSQTRGVLTKMDYLTYLKVRKWGQRVTGTTGKALQFFHRVGNDKWTFRVPNGPVLLKHYKYSSKHVKVLGAESPFSPNQAYWKKRQSDIPSLNARGQILFNKQKGICPFCKGKFYWDEVLEIDHIIPRHQGGSDEIGNVQLLHRHCHHVKSSQDSKKKVGL